jgi:hypothetical protein
MTSNPINFKQLNDSYSQRQQLYNLYNGEETKPIKRPSDMYWIKALLLIALSAFVGYLIGRYYCERNSEKLLEKDVLTNEDENQVVEVLDV